MLYVFTVTGGDGTCQYDCSVGDTKEKEYMHLCCSVDQKIECHMSSQPVLSELTVLNSCIALILLMENPGYF
jgi:hypothetical protein